MRFASLLAVAALLLDGTAQAELRATDDAGTQIVLARPAQRIVSLAPHLTEQLFAIGAGGRIVATTEFADHPEAARKLPRVARAHNVDLEQVAAARPDLIVVWGSGFPPATLAALRRLGVPVYVDEPSSLDGIGEAYDLLVAPRGCAGMEGLPGGSAAVYEFPCPPGWGEESWRAMEASMDTLLEQAGCGGLSRIDPAVLSSVTAMYNGVRRTVRGILSARRGKPDLLSCRDLGAAGQFPCQ